MDATVLEKILLKSESLKAWTQQFTFKRYLFEYLKSISSDFYVGIRGIRGIGKTVMLLQLANEFTDAVYFSADATYLAPYSVYDTVNALRKRGIKNVFIDEIHTKPKWQDDLKTLYDEHEVRVFFSGSNGLDIKKSGADLSRRAVLEELRPVSFREYIALRKNILIPIQSFVDILKNGKELSLKYIKASEYLDEYMRFGGVLYAGDGFQEALSNAIEKTITKDLAALRDINIKYESDAEKLLYHIAISKPFEVSFSSLANKLEVSKAFSIRLVHDLTGAGLLKTVFPCKGVNHSISKEPKIYLTVPLRLFFAPMAERGSIREEFFANHAPVSCYFKTDRGEKTPDFLIGKERFEVGGISKSREQKADYLVVESALWEDKKIPLYLFGLLY